MTKREVLNVNEQSSAIPVQIVKVVELGGIFNESGSQEVAVYAHLTTPTIVQVDDQHTTTGTIQERQYALLAVNPGGSVAFLGEINPETRRFSKYKIEGNRDAGVIYDRSEKNGVIYNMLVPIIMLDRLSTLDSVLSIPGITQIRELIPE